MKNYIVMSLLVVTLSTLGNPQLTAQSSPDSIRVINEALQLIALPDPEFTEPLVVDFRPTAMADMGFEQIYESTDVQFIARDGIKLHGRKYAHAGDKTVILLHGTLATSFTYNKMAGLLREATEAEVITPDLRGHGQSGGTIGDVSTLNQYAEDLEDIITAIRTEQPAQKIILAGHSMGGGIVLRHAETFPNTEIDRYLLFAPNLGGNAPTTEQKLHLQNDFVRTHLARGLGLSMLNEFGIHTYDSLHIVFYNLPEQMPLQSYSYRSMNASVPKDYRAALRAIQRPLLVLIGSADEVFLAEEYPPIVAAYSKGKCRLIEGATHNGVRHSPETWEKVRQWFADVYH